VQENTDNIQLLFEEALAYDRAGDSYNAVKLYKKLVRLAPNWSLPYHFLSLFYRERNEWKPSFHYSQKAIETNPEDKTAWQILATSATALRRWQTARLAWNQLGFEFRKNDKILNLDLGLIPICINPKTKPEIVWARQIGPARAQIESIPQPSSERRYKELVLIDNQPIAHRNLGGKRVPVFEELEKIRLSAYDTYAVILETSEKNSVDILDKLCLDAGIGFDNWSKATRQFWFRNQELFPEFFGAEIFHKEHENTNYQLIAFASKSFLDVKEVLHTWKIITLQSYRDLVRL
jgi:tetratricopeptide (TPR) repeat protein